ncbi:nucleotidyltransferase domain-containing protein [Cetobacterium sp.]|uniref:nucleotidyltransferase domain-containing protein n=1 Tax=Cetobacterium sp. TaxID=2071632 RepID=UPI003F2A9AFF
MNLGLKERELDEIKVLYYLFPQINQIIIFGSRARGNYNRTSDIDIAITGQIDGIIYKIRDYFEESNLL